MVIGFWLLHAAAYIIPRYRDPVMALLIAVMAVPLAAYLARHLPGFLPQPPQPAFLPARREGSWYAPHANARRSASAPLMR